jgi:malonyl-CoA decarboxylase
MSEGSLARLLRGFSRQGRDLLRKVLPFAVRGAAASDLAPADAMVALARDLLSSRGEASGVAIASDLLERYASAALADRHRFLRHLADAFNPDAAALSAAWQRYEREGPAALPALSAAVEAPRQQLFRLLNQGRDGTAALVRMRADLLSLGRHAWAAQVDADLAHLLRSWFNRGFLTLRALDWSSPARLLERVIEYEAVHDINGWDDLHRRLGPPDRRCFGFFHPAMPDDPLIFVEVALTQGLAGSIQAVLAPDRPALAAGQADTAIFYSISNCQPGLRGIAFGHFLIKQVATDLQRDMPHLRTFATLSPLPGLMAWLRTEDPALAAAASDCEALEAHREPLLAAAVRYLTEAKSERGAPLDPVARFHLGNGARLERLNWMADTSAKGRRESAALMVNYLYDLPRIEELHERHANHGTIATGHAFDDLAARLYAGAGKRRNVDA